MAELAFRGRCACRTYAQRVLKQQALCVIVLNRRSSRAWQLPDCDDRAIEKWRLFRLCSLKRTILRELLPLARLATCAEDPMII